MAKVLLSKLPQAVSEVIGNIYQGVIAARDTGIDWARSPEKVDFQVEVVLTANDIERQQLEELRGSTKVTEEGEQVTTQVQGPGRSVSVSNDSSESQRQSQSNGTNNSVSINSSSSSGSRSSSGSTSNSSSNSSSSSGSRSSNGSNSSSSNGSSSSSSSESSSGQSGNGGSHTTYTYG